MYIQAHGGEQILDERGYIDQQWMGGKGREVEGGEVREREREGGGRGRDERIKMGEKREGR